MRSTPEHIYRLLVEAVVDYAIYMLDPDGEIVSWNPGAQRFKGYRADEVIGTNFSRFYSEADRAAGVPALALERAVKDGHFESEGWRVRKDGTRFWAHVLIDPIFDDGKHLIGFAKVTRDLTERREAADELRQSQAQFRTLVQGVSDYAIYLLDSTGHVSSWNSGAERIKGYTANEIVGEHFSAFYTDEDRAAGEPQRNIRRAEETGRVEQEGWRVRKDGTRFWAHVLIDRILDDGGRLVGFAKVTRDVSEQRKAAEELEQARQALFQSQKLESIGQLTGGVAHDFNNLLMAIVASLELLETRIPDDPKVHRLLENAKAAAFRGASLTQRMLAFARRQELKPTAVDLRALVHGMSDLLQRSLGTLVSVEVTFPLKLDPVLVDGNQFELALLNLAVNARDAMPKGGTVTIAAAPCRIAADEDKWLPAGRYVCLSVSDEGHGMDPETLLRATEPFFSTKGVGKGTGLGLSMVHGLVEQSGGRLKIRSIQGQGTTMEIWLPAAHGGVDELAERAAPVQTNAAPAKALSVLAVDDDPLVLEVLVAQIEDLGHVASQASSGQEALALLKESAHFDVVITDHAMPGFTGTQLIKRMAQSWPAISVILATGYAELAEHEALDVIRLKKPYTRRDLVQALHAVVEPDSMEGKNPDARS
ncbi:MAG: PAS domain S-box protein [Rhodanobacter sp.]